MKLFLFALISFCQVVVAAQVIRIGNGVEPRELDCHLAVGLNEFIIIQNFMEPLANFDPRTPEKPAPGVAESWSSSKDGLVWTFKLRKNAKWSNGEPVTANDFVYGWTRLLNPATAAEYAYYAYFIKNGEKYNGKKITDPSQLGLKAKDANTFEVTLEKPTPYFEKLISFPVLSPAHKATVEKHGVKWTKPENIVSNGPYRLVSWKMNDVIVLKKSENYWNKDGIKIEEARFYPIEKADTEEKMFRTNALDATWTIPAEKIKHWAKDKSGVYISEPTLSTYYLQINLTRPMFADKRVRKALAYAIDRKQLTEFVTGGNEKPAYSFTPPGTGGFEPKRAFPTDGSKITEAKDLLAKAGFPAGKNFPKFDLLYNTTDLNKKVVQAVQQMWKKNLGINVGLVNQEWKVYLDSSRMRTFDIGRTRWLGDYTDPDTFLSLFITDGGNNNPKFSNADYDKLVETEQTTLDATKRSAAFYELEALLADEVPVIPLYVETRNYLISKKVKGWIPNQMSLQPLRSLRMEE